MSLAVTLGELSASRKVRLLRGPNSPLLDITVDNPRLWWPNGYGEQPLYPLQVRLGAHEVRKKIGLRDLASGEPEGQGRALHDLPRERRGCLLQRGELDSDGRPAAA